MWKGIAIVGIWGSIAAVAFSGSNAAVPMSIGATVSSVIVALA